MSVQNLVKAYANDPSFQLSMLRTFDDEYNQAKADGASSSKALLYALTTSSLNAAVEVSGGIESVPENAKPSLRSWLDIAFGEGGEEVVQGANSKLMQNVFYNKGNDPISLTDENAIISGKRGIQEFTDGTVVGGAIGGVQTGVNAAADILTNANLPQINITPQKPVQKIPVQTDPNHAILNAKEPPPPKPKQELSPKEMAEVGEVLIASGIMPQQRNMS